MFTESHYINGITLHLLNSIALMKLCYIMLMELCCMAFTGLHYVNGLC